MKFNRTGWLKKYMEFRQGDPFPVQLPSTGVKVLEEHGHHHQLDEAIYYFLQPTGLLYGFPVALPFPEINFRELEFIDPADKGHLIFLEALFACLVADRAFLLEGLVEESDHFLPAVDAAKDFFAGFAQNGRWKLPKISLAILSRKYSPADRIFENEVNRRVGGATDLIPLPGIYHNSFLFLDIYFCMLWQRHLLTEPDLRDSYIVELGEKQIQGRKGLIRTMIAAAGSSGDIEPQERRLIEWFLKSSGLPNAECAQLRQEMQQGLVLENIQIDDMPWLIRRFYLEAAIMTILVDRDLSIEEERFLAELVERLELWKEELDQGMMALEVFLLNQGDSLQILQERHFVFNVGANLRNQATLTVRKNLSRIVREIHETQELYNLLIKSTHTALTPEEKALVRAQLYDILKTIPALAIFALPGGGIILPILIKLLPFNLLPSSFED